MSAAVAVLIRPDHTCGIAQPPPDDSTNARCCMTMPMRLGHWLSDSGSGCRRSGGAYITASSSIVYVGMRGHVASSM